MYALAAVAYAAAKAYTGRGLAVTPLDGDDPLTGPQPATAGCGPVSGSSPSSGVTARPRPVYALAAVAYAAAPSRPNTGVAAMDPQWWASIKKPKPEDAASIR
ncbi:hypothetical protein JHV675_52530 [Mycobacterium avium subsp. hominissuis]